MAPPDQNGTNRGDNVYDVAIGIDGSMFLAGETYGSWSDADEGQTDFTVVKLDADGKEIWRWQDGTDSFDVANGILADADGSVILAGVSWQLWGNADAGGGDVAAVKLDENGKQVWRWQGGTSAYEKATAIASSGSSFHVLLAGFTSGAWGIDDNLGGNDLTADFAAVLLDTGIQGSPAPTSTPVQTTPPTTEGMPTPIPSTDTPVSTPTSSPTLAVDPPTLNPPTPSLTSSPALAADGVTPSKTTTMFVVFLSVGIFLIVMMGAGCLYRRRSRAKRDNAIPAAVQGWENDRDGTEATVSHAIPPPSHGLPSRQSDAVLYEGGVPPLHMRQKGTVATATSLASLGQMTGVPEAREDKAVDAYFHPSDPRRGLVGETGHEDNTRRPRSSVADPTIEEAERWPIEYGETTNAMPEFGASGTSPTGGCRTTVRGISIGHAVMATAQEMAQFSHIPGVTEAAGLVIVLMNLVKDSSELTGTAEHMVKRCRSMVMLLRRAASVFEEAGNTNEAADLPLIEDMRDAIGDLVQIIKIYQSKGKISQVMMSTLFKRRQEEAEAVIHAAMGRLQFGLQIQVGQKMSKLEKDLGGMRLHLQGPEGSGSPSASAISLKDRRMRRQRNLDRVEIPEDDVTVTDELLGKGGFGAVYIADYNGRNAAAKVVQVEHDLGKHDIENKQVVGDTGDTTQAEMKKDHDTSRYKVFWRELQAMIRLRSPHTVHVYGAITSRQDRLVLVMELLPGGDLRAMLKNAVEPLAEERARRIIRDVCTGMSFLHHKETIHGDLKSPNVLLDGTGRAKIGDFGTSKWPRLSNSTGLATYSTRPNHSTKMSYAWAAPEVLDAKSTSFASDVYSFGVVVWEVLSRKLPWEDECLRNIFVRVVIKEQHLEIPADSPPDLCNVLNACWDCVPSNRPTFRDILISIG